MKTLKHCTYLALNVNNYYFQPPFFHHPQVEQIFKFNYHIKFNPLKNPDDLRCSDNINILTKTLFGTKYSRMDQVKLVEDSL